MQIDWKPLARADMAKGLQKLQELVGDVLPAGGDLRLRRAHLPFYPTLTFYEVTDQAHQPPRQLYVLLDMQKNTATILDMTNEPVYKLNFEGYLQLSEATLVPYAAFFFSCVAGPYGLMPMIERLELPPGQTPDDETQKQIDALREVVPPKLLAKEENGDMRLAAALLFQGAVFKTEVLVTHDGIVTVEKHELALSSGDEEGDDGDDADGAEPNGADKVH